MGHSVWVTLDKAAAIGDARILGEDGTYQRYHWVPIRKPFHLTKEKHALRFHNRGEDGIKIDQVALVLRSSPRPEHQFVPIGILKQ